MKTSHFWRRSNVWTDSSGISDIDHSSLPPPNAA
jgi:hypothetical protein